MRILQVCVLGILVFVVEILQAFAEDPDSTLVYNNARLDLLNTKALELNVGRVFKHGTLSIVPYLPIDEREDTRNAGNHLGQHHQSTEVVAPMFSNKVLSLDLTEVFGPQDGSIPKPRLSLSAQLPNKWKLRFGGRWIGGHNSSIRLTFVRQF